MEDELELVKAWGQAPYSGRTQIQFKPINEEGDAEIARIATPDVEAVLRATPAPTQKELWAYLRRRGAGADDEAVAPYRYLNAMLNKFFLDNKTTLNTPGVVAVLSNGEYESIYAERNHAIFVREHNDIIYIFDPNDSAVKTTVNYDPRYFRAEGGIAQSHPLTARALSFNNGYGYGVCNAVSHAMSRLWQVLLHHATSVAVPRRLGEPRPAKDTQKTLTDRTFQRVFSEFVQIVVHPAITTKILLRIAFGTPDQFKEIAKGRAKLPNMRSAVETLRRLMAQYDESKLAAAEGAGAGAGAGAGGAGAGRKRLYTELEDGTLLVEDD